jgi:hypothetical protein
MFRNITKSIADSGFTFDAAETAETTFRRPVAVSI